MNLIDMMLRSNLNCPYLHVAAGQSTDSLGDSSGAQKENRIHQLDICSWIWFSSSVKQPITLPGSALGGQNRLVRAVHMTVSMLAVIILYTALLI